MGHPGTKKTIETLKRNFFAKKMTKKIREFIDNCDLCKINKSSTQKYGKLEGELKDSIPWELVYMDIYGPFDGDNFENNENLSKAYLLVIVDSATRWTEVILLKDIESQTIVNKFYNEWISRYPIPQQIHTDQGKQFISSTFTDYVKSLGIKSTTTLTENPQGNSICERINQTVGNILRIYKGYNLENVISLINNNLRSTWHKSIDCCPSELVFGVSKFDLTKQIDRDKLLKNAIEKSNKYKKYSQSRINKPRKDLDLIGKEIFIKRKSTDKLDEKNTGPFKIIEVNPEQGLVRIQNEDIQKWISMRKISYISR